MAKLSMKLKQAAPAKFSTTLCCPLKSSNCKGRKAFSKSRSEGVGAVCSARMSKVSSFIVGAKLLLD